jgi:hypothetical protein
VFGTRRAIVLAAAALTVVASASSAPAERRAQACRLGGPDEIRQPQWARAQRATMLVDSVLLSGKQALKAKRPCWRVSIRGRPALMVGLAERALRSRGRPVAPLVVVGLGYNSLWERGRHRYAHWAARFDREATSLLRTLRRLGARQIVWVTLREPSAGMVPPAGLGQVRRYSYYFPYVNQRLRRLDRRRRDLVLAHWRAASDRRGLTYDAIHVNTKGAKVMARTVWGAVSREAQRQAGRRRPERLRPRRH